MHTKRSAAAKPQDPNDLEFRPDELLTKQIIDMLADPARPLIHILAHAETSPELLSAWMLRPDIAERINGLESSLARRARLLAVGQIHRAAITATRILEMNQPALAHGANSPWSTRQSLRAAALSLSAARLLLNVARFDPANKSAPRRPQAPTTPPPADTPGESRKPTTSIQGGQDPAPAHTAQPTPVQKHPARTHPSHGRIAGASPTNPSSPRPIRISPASPGPSAAPARTPP